MIGKASTQDKSICIARHFKDHLDEIYSSDTRKYRRHLCRSIYQNIRLRLCNYERSRGKKSNDILPPQSIS
jgi:hypothetical protein